MRPSSMPALECAPGVPLVVPELNPEALDGSIAGMVASPGSVAIALALALRPLQAAAGHP